MNPPIALITGASRGIGRGIALELANNGCDIAGTATRYDPDNTESGLGEVKSSVEALGRRFLPIANDVAELEGHRPLVDTVLEAFGRIDVFVCNAGVLSAQSTDMLELDPAGYDRVMDVNVRGAFFLSQQVARQMLAQVDAGAPHTPHMIFISSVSAFNANPTRADYCISKAALSMAAQAFAVRLGPLGIPVYDLRPGIIETDMTRAGEARYNDLIQRGILLQPRWGKPEDVGKVCTAIVQGLLDYSTGAVIEVGGGFGVPRVRPTQ